MIPSAVNRDSDILSIAGCGTVHSPTGISLAASDYHKLCFKVSFSEFLNFLSDIHLVENNALHGAKVAVELAELKRNR